MPSTATITGKIGPGDALTAFVFTPLHSFSLDCDTGILQVNANGRITDVDVSAQTTLTLTVSAGVYTLTISA